MAQTNGDVPKINLDFLGAGDVPVDELTESAGNIVDEVKNLGKNGSANGEVPMPPDAGSGGPALDMGKLSTYAVYGISGLVLTYLIGKALE